MTLLNPIDAFIYSMTLSAAIDGEISDKKMNHIYYLIESLPIFQSYENKNVILAKQKIESAIPHRIKYFDAQDFNMYPLE